MRIGTYMQSKQGSVLARHTDTPHVLTEFQSVLLYLQNHKHASVKIVLAITPVIKYMSTLEAHNLKTLL